MESSHQINMYRIHMHIWNLLRRNRSFFRAFISLSMKAKLLSKANIALVFLGRFMLFSTDRTLPSSHPIFLANLMFWARKKATLSLQIFRRIQEKASEELRPKGRVMVDEQLVRDRVWFRLFKCTCHIKTRAREALVEAFLCRRIDW